MVQLSLSLSSKLRPPRGVTPAHILTNVIINWLLDTVQWDGENLQFYGQWTVEDFQNWLCAKSSTSLSVWIPGLSTLKVGFPATLNDQKSHAGRVIQVEIYSFIWCSSFIHSLHGFFFLHLDYRTHSKLCPHLFADLDLLTSWGGGGAYNGNSSRLYTPFSHCGECVGNTNGRIVSVSPCRAAWDVVTQFCRGKIMSQWRCGVCAVRKRDAALPPPAIATNLPPRIQSFGRCIAGQWVAMDSVLGSTMTSNLPLVHRSRRILPFSDVLCTSNLHCCITWISNNQILLQCSDMLFI